VAKSALILEAAFTVGREVTQGCALEAELELALIVLRARAREIIGDPNLRTARDERVDEVRPDEQTAARDE
jgi:hypothetical protein